MPPAVGRRDSAWQASRAPACRALLIEAVEPPSSVVASAAAPTEHIAQQDRGALARRQLLDGGDKS